MIVKLECARCIRILETQSLVDVGYSVRLTLRRSFEHPVMEGFVVGRQRTLVRGGLLYHRDRSSSSLGTDQLPCSCGTVSDKDSLKFGERHRNHLPGNDSIHCT